MNSAHQSPGFGKVLRNRNFALIWSAQTVSWFGDSLYFVSLLWLVKEMTGSEVMMGLVAASRTLPSLFGMFAGAFVDRWDRRRVMIATDLGRAAIVAAIPGLRLMGLLQPWHIPVVAFCLAALGVFFYPARQALVPVIVDQDDLTQANSLLTLSRQVVFIAGFATGGLLIAALGLMPMFTVDAVTFFASALLIWLIRLPAGVTRAPADAAAGDGRRGGLWREVKSGLAFIVGNRALLLIGPLAVVLNFVFAPLTVLMPSWVTDVLGADAAVYGFINTASMAGMAIGSLAVGLLVARFPRSRLAWVCLAANGIAILAFAAARAIPLALAAMLLFGVTNSVTNILFMTWMQTIVPRQIMGRVFGALETISTAAMPAGQALAGVAGGFMALPLLFTISGALSSLIALAYIVVPALRFAFSAMDLDKREEPAESAVAATAPGPDAD